MRAKRCIVTGAGGFIGFHLVRFLKKRGYFVIGVDIKYPEFEKSDADVFILQDLRDFKKTLKVIKDVDELYMLAADMGGMGYIDHVHASLMRNNTTITMNCLEASRINNIDKVFFSSSACVYPLEKQMNVHNLGLKESDAIPANPDTFYGWEKLYGEFLCQAYAKDYGLNIYIARLHNIYGPYTVFYGGREKSIAALCRKIALAKDGETIEIWGDGNQTRSYCYISDCCEGIFRLMKSDYHQPINIGTTKSVSINELVHLISKIAKKRIYCRYDLNKPQGVRGRNSDNSLCKQILHWEPSVSLEEGLKETYYWINSQVNLLRKN